MKAIITGASSGIGKEMAYYLDKLNYELILVARDEKALNEVKSKCQNAKIIALDLSKIENVQKLYEETKEENIDFLINDAGFGLFGYFNETSLDKELNMINVNIIALHTLTKLFLKDMINKNSGTILNVASSAGFFAGPYLSTYYATKNYVLKLTMAINEELRMLNSKVKIGALCPGPVDTNFNNVAGGHFNTKALSSTYVAKYGIDNVLKGKMIIIPSLKMKLGIFFSRFLPYRLQLKILYSIQKNKTK
jgi:uncharacterized protein